MDLEIRCLTATTRRATIARGGKLAAVLGLFATGISVGPAEAKKKKKKKKTFSFQATLTGANEVPSGSGDPSGTGSASFTIKGNQICGTFNYTPNPASPISGTHIHQGDPTIDGPIVIDFQVATIGVQKCLTCTSGGSCNPGFLGQIKANPSGFYANIHTTAFPDGAVRGQLVKG
jgi:hypothetical protein